MRENVFLGLCAVLALGTPSCSSDSSGSSPTKLGSDGAVADGGSTSTGGSGGRGNRDSGRPPDASHATGGSSSVLDAGSAECMPHASGATASPVSGVGQVGSTKTYGGSRITGASMLGTDTFVTAVVAPGVTTYGGKAISGTGAPRLVVADLDSTGAVQWAVGAACDGDPSYFETSLKATANGITVLVSGPGKITFGGTEVGVANETTRALATMSLTGTVTSFTALAFPVAVLRYAFGPSGDAYVFGGFDPGTDGGIINCAGTTSTGYGVARITTGGVALWTRCFGTAYRTADDIVVDGSEHVYVAGFPAPDGDFGLGQPPIDASAGGTAVVELDEAGAPVRIQPFLRLYADHLAVHSDGTLFVSGNMPQESARNGLMEFAGVRYLPCKTGGFQSHITRIDPDGHAAWSRAFGVRPNRLLVLPDKSVVFDTTLADGPPADGLSAPDPAALPALVYLTPSGDLHWVQTLGDRISNTQFGITLVPFVATATDIVTGGAFNGTLTIGPPLVAAQTGSDVLIRFTP